MWLNTKGTHSERTAKDTETFLRKWFCTRIKSKDDGMNTTVFVLCTADLRTCGSTWFHPVVSETSLRPEDKNRTHLGRKELKPLIGFILRPYAIKLHKILNLGVS